MLGSRQLGLLNHDQPLRAIHLKPSTFSIERSRFVLGWRGQEDEQRIFGSRQIAYALFQPANPELLAGA